MMDSREARETLADVAARRQHTVDTGSAPWPWPQMVLTAVLVVACGVVIDLDMIWVAGLLLTAAAGLWTSKLVSLRRTRSWAAAVTLSIVAALAADVGVQFVVRGADIPAPNTWGAAAAALVLLVVSRPLQLRGIRDGKVR